MSDQPKRFFDVWFLQANNVVKEVPFHVVSDWVQQGRAVADDRVKPSGTADWYSLGQVNAFQPYFPKPEPILDAAAAMGPVEMEFDWKKSGDDEDEDVDMIPLIDISLVLLIFFMMTTTVASLSRIEVPDAGNGVTIETNPGVIRIDIDIRDNQRIYAIGLGTLAPAAEDDNLTSDVAVFERLDARLRQVTDPPKVRIAAHGGVEFKYVEDLVVGLQRRRDKNQIRDYAYEVNERAGRP